MSVEAIIKTILFFAVLTMSVFANAQSLTPGHWKTKTLMVLNGFALPDPDSDECLSQEDATDIKARIEQELQSKGCALTKWTVRGSSITSTIACETDTFRATGTLAGQFTSKSYNIKGEAKGFVTIFPAKAQVSLSGVWVGACPR